MIRLVPQSLRRKGVDYYRRARILVASYLAVALFNLVMLVLFLGPLSQGPLSALLAGAGLCGLGVVPVLHRTGSVSWASNVFLLQIWLLLHALAFYLDGGFGPALATLLFLPSLAISICNKRAAIFWTATVGVEVLFLTGWSALAAQGGPWVGSLGSLAVFAITFVCLLTHLAVTAFFHEDFKDRTLSRLSRTNEQLARARDKALEANRAKSTFVANMSHELRTPLNAVIGYADMLAEDVDSISSEELTADLYRIKSSGKHLLRLINELLEFSRLESGRIPIERSVFSIEVLVEEMVSTMEREAAKNGNRIKVVLCAQGGDQETSGLEAPFCSDPTKLRQCLYNLMANACKFTKDGEIVVRAERLTASTAQGRDLAVFEVADNGIGMSPEQLEKVFEPFVQAEESIARRFGGTGLGLSLSRRLAVALGGSLEAFSDLGQGSRFVLTVPDLPKPACGESYTLLELPDSVLDGGAGRAESSEQGKVGPPLPEHVLGG